MKQRVDLFTPVHKAIRAILFDLGKELQHTDMADEKEMTAMLTKLSDSLELLEEHARHEDQIIFPPIEQACPGMTTESIEEHQQYEEKIATLENLIRKIRNATDAAERLQHANQLRFHFAEFIAFYLMHMNHEEATMLEASIENLSPEQLIDIRVRVQMDTAPARYAEWLKWMLPSLDMNELVPLFRQVKMNAPETVYDKFKKIGKETMDGNRWTRLRQLAEISD